MQIFKTLEVLGAKMGKEKWFTKPDGINKFKDRYHVGLKIKNNL